MEFRRLGKTNLMVSAISFGAMRIPLISEEEAYKVINKAIDLKMNYFETAPFYGDSEIKLGKSLGKRRKEIYLSTKVPYGDIKTADDTRKMIDSQLKRLQTDYFDFYQMWYINSKEMFDQVTAKGGNLDGAIQAKKEGIVKHIGFTTHAKPEEVEEFLKTGLFESVTIYYNVFSRNFAKAAKLAKELDIGVVVMGPLNGGFLGSNSGKLGFLKRGKADTNAAGALRWLIGDTNVTTAIAGMRSVKEVEDNAKAGDLYEDIKNTNDFIEIAEEFDKLKKTIPNTICSNCGYCMPCPQNVPITSVFELTKQINIYNTLDFAKDNYSRFKIKADKCTECGECVKKCTQKLNIPEDLKKAHQILI